MFQHCFDWEKNYPNYVPLWNARHSQAMQEKVLKKTTPMFFFVLTPDIVPCPAITFCCSKDWRKLPISRAGIETLFASKKENNQLQSIFAR
jgi:hypothetical protein